MITNFEHVTFELTNEEMEILPLVMHGFRHYKKTNPIKAELIVSRMNVFLHEHGYKIKMSQPRLRKMVNYIRSNSLIPLIANSQGYFTSDCKQTILEQITSLQERANSIERCAQGLKKFL
jgi:hypothetical protein